MPVKQVHFADGHRAFYYPSTPSSTSSESSSLPSSSGPLTPPLLIPLGYRLSFSPLPVVDEDIVPGAVRINPILGFSNHPAIKLDLRDHPSTSSLSSAQVVQPATKPAVPALRIVCIYLPWEIIIPASSGLAVSVGDVLGGLYAALRINAKSQEFADIPSSDYKRRTNDAYLARCQRFVIDTRVEEEKRLGVKRVDFLMGINRWMGLASTTMGPDVWQLVVF